MKRTKKKPANVFETIGFSKEESKELMRKSHLLDDILGIVKAEEYTQKDLAKILDQKQPHVSDLLRGKLGRFSVEKLIDFLERLGATVELKVKYKRVI